MSGRGRQGPGRLARVGAGRLALAIALGAYFSLLWAIGGTDAWGQLLGAPHLSPDFADMRTVTSAWECLQHGIDPLPHNPCDPYPSAAREIFIYPRVWLLPSALGIGQGATVALGVATAILFFGSLFFLMGRASLEEGLIYSAAAVSPAVMLGVERGNTDLLMFPLLVAALAMFRGRALVRVTSYGLLLVAAMLKLFPVFAWGVLLRQRRRLIALSGTMMVGLFGAYVLATAETIRAIQKAYPSEIKESYGADVGVDGLQQWAAGKANFDWLTGQGDRLTALLVLCAIALIFTLSWRRRHLGRLLDAQAGSQFSMDCFVAGAGIYVGTFLTSHNYDYRLIFLLLTLPQLITWARAEAGAMPAPRLTLGGLLATLWLSEPLSEPIPGFWASNPLALNNLGLPLEEVFNWFLFVTVGTGLVLATVPPLLRAVRPTEAVSPGMRKARA
jgi:hypothetical protein